MNDDTLIETLRAAVDDACAASDLSGLVPAVVRSRHRHRVRSAAAAAAGLAVVGAGTGAVILAAPGGHPARATVRVAAPQASATVAGTIDLSPDLVDADFFTSGAESHLPSQITSLATADGTDRERACLATHGFQLTVLDTVGETHLEDVPDLAYIAADGFGVSSSYVSGFDPFTSSAAQQDAYGAADGTCQATDEVGSPFATYDAISTKLAGDWLVTLHEINAEPAPVAAAQGLGSCFARYGIRAATEEDFFDVIGQSATATDDKAYATCMAPVEAARISIREADRSAFFAAHRAELTALEADELALKRQLGVTDTSPPQAYPAA